MGNSTMRFFSCRVPTFIGEKRCANFAIAERLSERPGKGNLGSYEARLNRPGDLNIEKLVIGKICWEVCPDVILLPNRTGGMTAAPGRHGNTGRREIRASSIP